MRVLPWSWNAVSIRELALFACATAATPAAATSLESLRFDGVSAVEAGVAGCGVTASDVGGEVPVPPVTYAERVYYRATQTPEGPFHRLVGMYGRSDDGGWWGYGGVARYFIAPNGNLLGTIGGDGPDYLAFSTPLGGTVAYLNAYFTVGPYGQQVRDYNGSCDGYQVTALLGQNLVDPFQRCVRRVFSAAVVSAICTE